jgi:hypothetical protein
MSFDLDSLYKLLPAIYRILDIEQSESRSPAQAQDTGEESFRLPLRALLEVIAQQIGILDENLAQLYDDQFIETCAEWVIPYIGDLIGYQTPRRTPSLSQRSEVGNTIAYRSRKGTAVLMEQLVQDVTGWSTHIVEYFQLLAATQHVNQPRLNNSLVNLGEAENLEWLGTPFETQVHTADIRNMAFGRPSYNLLGIGIFLWRLTAYPLTGAPAARAFSNDPRRYLFSPLGNNMQLFSLPQRDEEPRQLSGLQAVAIPISRSMLQRFPDDYYGAGKSLLLTLIENHRHISIPLHRITFSDLSDSRDSDSNLMRGADGNPTWQNMPEDRIAIDPILGRIAFPGNEDPPAEGQVYTSFHYGFSADLGGGEYQRATTFTQGLQTIERVSERHSKTIQEALNALKTHRAHAQGGVVEITDGGSYIGSPEIRATGNQRIELRAANFNRPMLALQASKGIPELLVQGEECAEVILNGLLISNGPLRVTGKLGKLTLRHCTLVPGLSLSVEDEPEHPRHASLIIESPYTQVEIDHCIVGGLRVQPTAQVRIINSIVDATRKDGIAYASQGTLGDHNTLAGGALYIENSTIIGRVHADSLELASNTIFLAGTGEKGESPVHIERRQQGLVRYSYVPPGSRTPRHHRCQPESLSISESEDIEPTFTSLRYGNPGYCQLLLRTSAKIRQGADDEAEMGAFHDLLQPQREVNLRARLKEYLRFTTLPEIIYMT